MKSKKSIKTIKRQLIDIFGYSKANLIQFIENVRDNKCPSWDADKALRLVKGCVFVPKKGINTTAKRTVYRRTYQGKQKETTHPYPPQSISKNNLSHVHKRKN